MRGKLYTFIKGLFQTNGGRMRGVAAGESGRI